MKKITSLRFALLVVCSLAVLFTSGQSVNRASGSFRNNWQINYQLGFTQFYGDAASNGFFKKFSGETAFGTSLTARKFFSPVFGLGLDFYYTGVKSHKQESSVGLPVDVTLTGNYFDVNLQAYLDFTNLLWGRDSRRKLSFYGTLAFGYGFWNTELYDGLSGITIKSGVTINNDTYKTGGIVIPVGFGLNYRLSDHWSVNMGGNFRTILNDDLDVWRGGFEYDQLFYGYAGISYHINPLFGVSRKSKKSKKTKEPKNTSPTTSKKEPRPTGVIPLFDYTKNSKTESSGGGGGSRELDVIGMEQPIPPKALLPEGFEFRVQIMAKRDRLPGVNVLRSRYDISGDVYENHQDGIYRYSTGSFTNYQDAVRHSQLLKSKGVSDAFVVAYKNNKRVALTSEMKR